MTQAMTALIENLHHVDKNVRGQAAVSIGKLDDAAMVSVLLDALITEPDLYVREDITWALVRLQDAALEPVSRLLDDSNPATRHLAVHVLTKIGGTQVVDPLITALADTDAAVLSKAAFGLGQIGDARAILALVDLLGHPSRDLETMLMDVMERFGTAATAPLINALYSDNGTVREQAADILGQIGDHDAVPALIAALRDPLWQVRFAAVTALSHLGGVQAKTAIQALANDPEVRVRELVIKVTRRMKG